jgi:pentatricopeptide repeat protein
MKKPKPSNQLMIVPKEDKTTSKVKWRQIYSDPYLLSKRITGLIKSQKDGAQKAFELVNRHAGTCNKEVYGSMVSALAKEKKYTDMLKLYDIMIRRNRFLSPQGYTAIFHAMATYAESGDWNHKSICMQATDKIWNHAIDSESFDEMVDEEIEAAEPKISNRSINALLHVCGVCCYTGGYNLAWEVFEQMGNVAEYPHKYSQVAKCLADHVTYSMMMGVCISADNLNAFRLGIQLWNNYKHLLVKKPGKDFSTIENELISKAITLYTSSSEFDLAFKEVKSFFGLSKDGSSKLERKVYLPDIIVILKLCRRSKNEAFGLKWLKLIEKEQSSIFTHYKPSDFYRHYVKSEIVLANYENCYNRLLKDNTCPIIYKLWVCLEALKACRNQDISCNVWFNRVKELKEHADFDKDMGHIYFYMKCGLLMNETETVKSLLESKKAILERYLTRKVSKRDGIVDFDDFRVTVRKVMRWRFEKAPITYH